MVETGRDLTLAVECLEAICPNCAGTGKICGLGEQAFVCRECDGTGYILTDAGEQFFSFVARTIKRLRSRCGSD